MMANFLGSLMIFLKAPFFSLNKPVDNNKEATAEARK
jgi:hypothetical protein